MLPEVTVDVAKLAEELEALTEPGVTVMVGVVLRVTPLTFTVNVLTVPAVVPVKLVVYVPAVAEAITVLKVPLLVPPERVRVKALPARPLMGLPEVSLTTIVSRSLEPETSVELVKLAVELIGLTATTLTVADALVAPLVARTVAEPIPLLGAV
jgi:hypothetical protein